MAESGTPTAVRWHASRAVLELIELVLDGALPPLPDTLALLGAEDVATLSRRVDPTHPLPPAGPLPDGLIVEDAEGTPVARIRAGRLVAGQPFSHPPLRAHRHPPGPPGPSGGFRPALVVVVDGLPSSGEVLAAVAEAAAGGLALVWLVVVGAGRGPLVPEAAWRASAALVERATARGLHSWAVPVAVPLIVSPGSAGGDAAGGAAAGGAAAGGAAAGGAAAGGDAAGGDAADPLPALVGAAWARHLGGASRLLAGAAEPAFARELATGAAPVHRRGLTVFLTGLSGSGKSTIAKALAARLTEQARRPVTLLDGDEVRRLLSAGLGFSRQDRDLNIRRIGFVAAEVSRHGGLAICAPIAPFAAVRAAVRAAVEAAGGELVLVHVATPLEECERRDRKGLYARARRGEIPDFTGISSPYEAPQDADLTIDTTSAPVQACIEQVWSLLLERGYVDELDLD